MPGPYTAAQLDHAVSLYTSGKTFDQVAAETGMSAGTVHRAVKARGIEPPRAYRTSPEAVERAVRLYLDGKTSRQVHAEAGVPPSVLSRELRKRGITARTNRKELPSEDIVNAYLAGESELALSQRYRVGREVIRRRLEEAGVPIRDNVEAGLVRMAKLSPEERAQLTQKANEAARSRDVPAEELLRRAQHREQTLSHASEREFIFAKHLQAGDIEVVPQKAIGPYNIDLAVGTVAVEILGGNWHGYRTSHAQRTPYILNRGWDMLFIWDQKRARLCIEAAQYVIAFAQEVRRNPSPVRQYRVIRGDGQLMAVGRADDDEFPLVPPSEANFRGRPID